MKIKNISFKNFRNLENTTLDICKKEIILRGENGQGKTNFLEALYILCYGSSFRTQKLIDCIKHKESSFFLSLCYSDNMLLENKISFNFFAEGKNTKKKIKVDEKQIEDRKDLIYSLPCIVFSHEDIEFVRGEPENRRRFFNQIMTMHSSEYFEDLRKYKRILRQRNAAIKDLRTDLLPVYDIKLVNLGQKICVAREKICKDFNSVFADIYNYISGEKKLLQINYKPSWSLDSTAETLIEKLALQKETDMNSGTTTSGPHRDRFVITDENGLFKNSASTGQMRLTSIVMRIVQAEFFRCKTTIDPILLIDDVLLELDLEKRKRCFSALGKYNQAIFTFLPEEKYFSQENDFLILDVNKGVITEK